MAARASLREGGSAIVSAGDGGARSLPGHAKLSLTSTGRDIVLCFKVVPRFFPGRDAGCQRWRQRLEKKRKKKKRLQPRRPKFNGCHRKRQRRYSSRQNDERISNAFRSLQNYPRCNRTIFCTIRC